MISARTSCRAGAVALLALTLRPASSLEAQTREPTPVRQSDLTHQTAVVRPLTLRDAARDDRWLGLGVRDVRWAPDGSGVYFRWSRGPASGDVPEEDPWFLASADGEWVTELRVAAARSVPGASLVWSATGHAAAWVRDGALYVYSDGETRRAAALPSGASSPRFTIDGASVDFESGEALVRYSLESGEIATLALRTTRAVERRTDAAAWLARQQRDLFDFVRERADTLARSAAASRALRDAPPQAIPVPPGVQVDQITLSPDGRWVTFRALTRAPDRAPTEYIDFASESGYATVKRARAKVGEPRDIARLGVVEVDPLVPVDSIEVRWIDLAEAGDQNTFPHGPVWSPDGTRAVVQFIGEDHEDVWFAEIDPASASAMVLTHDHDEAWIGGPPVQANYLQPALMEWLPGGELVFASERSGWSHLYVLDADGAVTPLTEGEWEVRAASLSRDRSSWLLQASREHPSDDHLYVMPALGGQMERLTEGEGRHEGRWSPSGEVIAVLYGNTTELPDLFLLEADAGAQPERVTVSGADNFYEHPLVEPEVVTIPHPDGGVVWAAIYRPREQNAERAALVHIHGGGYRQFAHRGYSVYGYSLHLGFIHYMLERGYTVLDFDYRGSAGFGRDYRTDISESMGISDTDGAAAAARWLTENENVHPERIGIYGVSYGGFLTLMALFRYPGVFGAGVARAAVTDLAHYSDGWTSRVLGIPAENPDAYERSSPINYAEGLADPLLITHGLVDGNVHFQDAARLVQRLIELEKDFEVMYYPIEPHTVETEASRFDLMKRQSRFFDQKLRGLPPGGR